MRPLLVLALVLAPLAAAGTAAAEEPYYVRVGVVPPEAPHAASPNEDCAAGARPPDARASANRAIAPFRSPPDPKTFNGVSPYFPTCVSATAGVGKEACATAREACAGCAAAPVLCGAPLAYASYNVATGRYYVAAGDSLPLGVPLFGTAAPLAPIAGRGPATAEADCYYCPPLVASAG